MKPADRLARAVHDLAIVQREWPTFHHAIRTRTHDGFPSTVGGGNVNGSDVPDPVHNAVASRTRFVDPHAHRTPRATSDDSRPALGLPTGDAA